jgi:hypothetical protein
MKKLDLKSLTVPQLIERFSALAVGQFQAELFGKVEIYNRLYDDIVAVKDELRSRTGDQRSALVSLYTHANPQVDYWRRNGRWRLNGGRPTSAAGDQRQKYLSASGLCSAVVGGA